MIQSTIIPSKVETETDLEIKQKYFRILSKYEKPKTSLVSMKALSIPIDTSFLEIIVTLGCLVLSILILEQLSCLKVKTSIVGFLRDIFRTLYINKIFF